MARSKSAKVLTLVPKRAEQSQGCVATLENMLALAKSGELTGVAVAGVDAEGYTHTAFESGDNIATLIGAVERVKYRLLNHQADI